MPSSRWDEIFCCKLFRNGQSECKTEINSRDQESRIDEIQTGRIQEERERNMKLEGALGIMATLENTIRSIKDRNDESK